MTSLTLTLVLFAADLGVMAVFTESKTVLVVGVVAAGAFLGVNNTLITTLVMGSAPVERPVASAAYSFVRFSGGAFAPYAAGKLGEHVSIHAPFWMGFGAVAISVAVLAVFRRTLPGDTVPEAEHGAREEAEAVLVGDAD